MKRIVKNVLTGILSTAMCVSVLPANAAIVKADDYKYVVMNIPYSEFYEAEISASGIKSLEQQTKSNVDAVTTATTSKYKGTSGMTKGTYYDTTKPTGEILGVSFPVKMTSSDYEALKDTYLYVDSKENNDYVTDVKGSYYFKDYVGENAPAVFKTLTYSNGTYSFSEAEGADGNQVVKDASNLSVTDLTCTGRYGDYQVSLEGVSPAGNIDGTPATIYGTIFVDSDNEGYAMYPLDNLWLATRIPNVQVAWSVKHGRGLQKGHGSGGPFYQYDMNGKTISKVILITNAGNYTIVDNTKLPKYYEGNLDGVKCSVSNSEAALNITGIPSEFQDVTVSVSNNLANKAAIVDGKVALTDVPKDGVSYTVTVYSSNFCNLSYTVATVITDAQVVELQKWVGKANSVKNNAEDKAKLEDVIARAQAAIDAKNITSVQANTLITEIKNAVKNCYADYAISAKITGSKLSITSDKAMAELENPTYSVSYTSGRSTLVFESGDLTAFDITLEKTPTVGTTYKVTIVSDNYKDAVASVVAEEAAVDPTPDPEPEEPIVIQKGETTISIKDITTTYTGKPVQIEPAVVKGSKASVVYGYYTDKTCTKALKAAPVDAGVYYARAQVAADDEYEAAVSNVATITIAKAVSKAVLSNKSVKYTGKEFKIGAANVTGSKGNVTYAYYTDKACTKSVKSAVNAGVYYVKATVAADKNYKAAVSNVATLTISKAAQSITKVTSSKTIKYASLKKKAQSFKLTAIVLGKAKVSFKKASGNNKISVASNGKVTVKKGLKKGTYAIKIKITVSATANYVAKTVTKTIKIVIK